MFPDFESEAATVTMVLGTLATSAGASAASYLVLRVARGRSVMSAQIWDFDERHRIELRRHQPLYRWFEPLIRELEETASNAALRYIPKLRAAIERSLDRGGAKLPFSPASFLACAAFEGVLAGFGALSVTCLVWSWGNSILMASLIVVLVAIFRIKALFDGARGRLEHFKLDLPFAIDLVACMLCAGATLHESLDTVVSNMESSPVHDEFQKILCRMDANQSFVACLEDLNRRMHDADIREFVFAISQGHQNGTPIRDVLTNVATQVRLRHTQMIESRCGTIHTMLTFPQFVIFLSALLAVLAPFAITAWNELKL